MTEIPDAQAKFAAITEALEETSQLAQREHQRTQMYGAMVHKLKSPLTAITGFAESLQAKLPNLSKDQIAQRLDKIVDNTKEMARLIEADLEYIKNEFTGWQSDCEFVHLNAALLALVDDLRLFYPTITAAAPLITTPVVFADLKILAIIIQHLVENAYKHGDNTEPIILGTVELPRTVGISVTNWVEEDGSLPLHEVDFKPFGTHARGTGLGLYIVKQYAESMGGSLTILQERDDHNGERRTTFTLWLQKESSSYTSDREEESGPSISSGRQ